ncbi:energy transducer TonB [Pedobacter frigiditerrae]|uniref:Energy transducer TonB n=1 Tax=Pedobacter frigiditerrae TaxID=2530452 RepID=A0A4R0MS18_9SPHI|nr:energy transducer TonB [Pedobacter frigiditerrae]TCC89533.1 energy transducer TonB [Pedobacter frigiditerrae]
MTTTGEENNYPKAIAISAVLMGLFIALSFIWVIGAFQPEEPIGMGGMVVNYGTSETGMGSDYTSIEEPSMDPNANNKLPDKVTPEQKVTPTTSSQVDAKDVITQNSEDAVAINTKATKSTNAPTSATESKPAQPTINPNALYKGNKNNGKGQGDGTGTTPGNQGSINGDPLAPNYGEGGSGNGNTPIPLSKFNNLVTPTDDGQETGKIVVKIRVNRNGQVISATAGAKGTTFSNDALFRKCERAVMNATLDRIENGPEVRTAVVVFNFKVK